MDRRNEWQDFFAEEPITQSIAFIPLDVLIPWTDADGNPQPFKPYSEKQMQDLTENIRQHGVLSSIRVRPVGDGSGRYQIIAGHNRVEAARRAGLITIPAIAKPMTDDEAAIAMADSNLQQRDKILPSERAYAYKVKLEAIKRQGQRTDLTSTHCVSKLSADEVGTESETSRESVRRYIRLTYLIPELLARVDEGKLGLTPAVELSYLPEEPQIMLNDILNATKKRVSKGVACQLRAEGDNLTEDRIYEILGVDTAGSEETPKAKKVTYKLDVSGFDDAALAVLKTDEELHNWLLDQLQLYLSQHTKM